MRETAQAHIRNAMQIVLNLIDCGEPAFLKGGSARTVTVEELQAINNRLTRALRELDHSPLPGPGLGGGPLGGI